MNEYKVGDVAEVKIVNLMPFGAFAEIVPGVDGLIHVYQITDKKIAKPSDVLNVGDVVKVEIIAVDEENRKISLSMRSLIEANEEAAEEAETTDAE
jgi:4-hydroxy-3-methylbut-2-enyl diphosphate reductase